MAWHSQAPQDWSCHKPLVISGLVHCLVPARPITKSPSCPFPIPQSSGGDLEDHSVFPHSSPCAPTRLGFICPSLDHRVQESPAYPCHSRVWACPHLSPEILFKGPSHHQNQVVLQLQCKTPVILPFLPASTPHLTPKNPQCPADLFRQALDLTIPPSLDFPPQSTLLAFPHVSLPESSLFRSMAHLPLGKMHKAVAMASRH